MWKEFSKADNMSVFEIKNKQFLLKLSKSLAYYKKNGCMSFRRCIDY